MEYVWPVIIGGGIGLIIYCIKLSILEDFFRKDEEQEVSTTNNYQTLTEPPPNSWIKNSYVDQFQNPTGQTFITTRYFIPGQNTTPLTPIHGASLQLGVDSNSVWLRVHQGDVIVEPRSYDNNPYQVELLTNNGKKVSFIGRPANNGLIYLENHKVFVNLLIDEQASIKIYLAHLDTLNSTSTYLFYVDPRGFENMVRRKALNA